MLGLLLSYYILYSGNDANDPFLWSDALKSPQIGSHTSKIGFRFPSWHSKIQRLFDLLVWKDTHFHVKFDLETPNCLPIIANNPDNCNDFPVIFKVICQNWEFTNLFFFFALAKNQSLAKRWWWIFKNWALTSFFFCIDIQSVALQSESCTLFTHRPCFQNGFQGGGVVKKLDLQKWLINGLDSHLGISMLTVLHYISLI